MSGNGAINLTKENFNEVINGSKEAILVDFWAPWCGPCRMVGPILEEIALENQDKLKVGKVNVDEEPSLAQQFGIMSIPTMIVFKGGEAKTKMVGARGKEELLEIIKSYL